MLNSEYSKQVHVEVQSSILLYSQGCLGNSNSTTDSAPFKSLKSRRDKCYSTFSKSTNRLKHGADKNHNFVN
jgi:hypothetical protein